MASHVRALVCCTVNHSCLTKVRGVIEDCDREDKDGSDADDCDRDYVSVSDHEAVNKVTTTGSPKKQKMWLEEWRIFLKISIVVLRKGSKRRRC